MLRPEVPDSVLARANSEVKLQPLHPLLGLQTQRQCSEPAEPRWSAVYGHCKASDKPGLLARLLGHDFSEGFPLSDHPESRFHGQPPACSTCLPLVVPNLVVSGWGLRRSSSEPASI